jgi:hypothetical protein
MLVLEKFLLVLRAYAQATLSCTSAHPDHIRERVQLRQNLSASADLPVPTAYPQPILISSPVVACQGHTVFATKWAISATRIQVTIIVSDFVNC